MEADNRFNEAYLRSSGLASRCWRPRASWAPSPAGSHVRVNAAEERNRSALVALSATYGVILVKNGETSLGERSRDIRAACECEKRCRVRSPILCQRDETTGACVFSGKVLSAL